MLKLRSRNTSCATKRPLDHATLQQIAPPYAERLPQTQSLLSDEQCDLPKRNGRNREITPDNCSVGQTAS